MLLTDACAVEHGGQHQQDVVGPVLPVVGHLVLLDHQDVEVVGALQGVVQVEQAVLLAARGGGEDGALQPLGVLQGAQPTGSERVGQRERVGEREREGTVKYVSAVRGKWRVKLNS